MKTTLLLSIELNTSEYSTPAGAIEGLTQDLDYFLSDNHWKGRVLTCDPLVHRVQRPQPFFQVPIKHIEQRA